jgi:hypothetical protein
VRNQRRVWSDRRDRSTFAHSGGDMTEADWWGATETGQCIECIDALFAEHSACNRKTRQFGLASCVRLAKEMPSWPRARYLDVVEGFVGERHDRETLLDHIESFDAYVMGLPSGILHALMRPDPLEHTAADRLLSLLCEDASRNPARQFVADHESLALLLFRTQFGPERGGAEPNLLPYLSLLHDIFGPLPFRDVAVAAEWLTSDVLALARGVYDEKAFDRMPILADALQDAGCDNAEALDHCRAANWEHVRGCWVIDLLLGRPWREPSGGA